MNQMALLIGVKMCHGFATDSKFYLKICNKKAGLNPLIYYIYPLARKIRTWAILKSAA